MKKSFFRKICVVILMLSLVFSMNTTAFAAINPLISASAEKTVIYTTTKEERDQHFNQVMESILTQLPVNERGSQYRYRTEYYDYEYQTLGGFAGNQPPSGHQFPTGGGFYYSDSGGPTVSGSFAVSLPAPYNFVSLSVNLGAVQDAGLGGYYVEAPNTTNYFKLYIEKVMEIRPYAVYRAVVGTDDWELYTANAVSSVNRMSSYAVAVG